MHLPTASVAHGVRIALAVRNETQDQFARRIGMHPSILSRILSGSLRGSEVQWQAIWRGLSSEDAE